ncbi:MAG: urease accessory UreF family protein [Pseudomonadota bacterium]
MHTTETTVWLGPLLQFSSANLPVGAFSYSQGLEWAIETGWVHDTASLHAWCADWIAGPLARQDLPLLHRLHTALEADDVDGARRWAQWTLACRETRELRDEERTRARAVLSLLDRLFPDDPQIHRDALLCTPLAGLARAAVLLGMPSEGTRTAHAWGWLENTVLVGVKHIPLGQSDGQCLLMQLWPDLHAAISAAHTVDDDDIGCSLPAASFASAAHETQYSRLYRS